MRKEQSERTGLKIDNVDRVRRTCACYLHAERIGAQGIEQWSGLAALGNTYFNPAFKAGCVCDDGDGAKCSRKKPSNNAL